MSRAVFAALVAVCTASGQNKLNGRSMLHITMPEDAPLQVLSADWGESVASPRGSAMLLDLRTSLTFRNTGSKRVRGVTLLVMAQEVAPGGKASVSVPSLDAGSGDNFPVRLDLRLLRPMDAGEGPLVEVSLDGILFDDLAFYGPNKLNSRRSMTQWELEARRDRRYMKTLFERAGDEGIRQHMVNTVARLSERPAWDVQLARGRSTVQESSRTLRFAFLQVPGEPVRAVSGAAKVAGAEVRSPEIQVQNVSGSPVKYLEIGWILSDSNGNSFYAGAVPASVNIAAGQRTTIEEQDAALKLTNKSGRPGSITGMKGFVNHVEFSDGRLWIPDRASLTDQGTRGAFQPSAEEQRLATLYKRKGLAAVLDEIRKF